MSSTCRQDACRHPIILWQSSITLKIFTSRTSSASMLIKGSEICNAHTLRIMGEMMGSTDVDVSLPTWETTTKKKKKKKKGTVNQKENEICYTSLKLDYHICHGIKKTWYYSYLKWKKSILNQKEYEICYTSLKRNCHICHEIKRFAIYLNPPALIAACSVSSTRCKVSSDA